MPELVIADGIPDVKIIYSKTPSEITGAIEKNDYYQATKDQFLFQVAGVGRYYVTNGDCIVVEPDEQAEASAIRLFLLGTAFGVLLLQRGVLPIHGSAVVVDGQCVIFTGVSGAGKSTLAAAFREKGYSFLTDDVAAVTFDAKGVPWVQPGYPQQKLWRDSAEHMDVDVSICSQIRLDIDKYAVVVQEGFCQEPVRLVTVCELRTENCQNVTMTGLSGQDKLAVLINHTYRVWLLEGLNLKTTHFKQCIDMAKQILVSRLTRPEGIFSVEEQVRLVEQYLGDMIAERAV